MRLLDTNLLIDFLKGEARARPFVFAEDAAVSVVTRIEVLAGPVDQLDLARDVLSELITLPLDEAVADEASVVRRELRLKLPDAVVLATARVHRLELITRDERAFGGYERAMFPYRL